MPHDVVSSSLHTPLQANSEGPPDLTTTVLKLDTRLISGIGAFSVVYRCSRVLDPEVVAVKAIVFPPSFGETEKNFEGKVRRELGIWRRLSHPNITPLLGMACGTYFGSKYPCMVSAWMVNGTLFDYVEKRRSTLSLPDRIKLIKGSISGLKYLHSRDIIHGDFHPGNILIDDDYNPRLTDFGLSRTFSRMPAQLSYLYTNTIRAGAMMWAAPELVYPELYPKLKFQATLHSDIYSLGSIILFILSGRWPWKERGEAENKLREFQNPPRPTWPVNMPDSVWDFIERCWSPRNPGSRPSAQEVLSFSTDKLEQLLRPNLPSNINVVLLGALGSGKSSIINLLAEKEIAQISSEATPCTKRPRSYQISIESRNFRLWDTMGFSLAHEGRTSHLLPYEHVHSLLRSIPECVSLILLCADKGTITPSLRRLYWLVNNFFYGGCAPIAFIVTHCDTLDEEWWERNKCYIAERTTIPTQSIPHACITTDPAGCNQSRHTLKELLHTYATAVAPISLRLDLSSYTTASLDLATHCRLTSSEAEALVVRFGRPLRTFNVVFFGEPGAGTSEIVDLLAGRPVAETSPGAIRAYSCSYGISTGMQHFRIWEGTDADEARKGSDICEQEEPIRDLSSEGGVDLLVLCTRFGRIAPEERSFGNILQRKAPVAVLLTHFDSPNPMEQWWEMNRKELIKSLGGDVIGRVCIPPLASCGPEGIRLDKTVMQSRFSIHDMLEHCASSRHSLPPGERIKGICKAVMGKIRQIAMPAKSYRDPYELTRKQTF